MISKPPVLQRQNLTWLLIATLIVLVADPLGIFAGNFSNDSYSQIRSELSKTKDTNVLLIGSWDDFYSLEYNNYWRQEVNTYFVEREYGEVLDAASLGDKFFNMYLNFEGITHILVPRSTFDNGMIRHKFSNRGSIEIQLASSFFKTLAGSSGPYASVLLRVNKPSDPMETRIDPTYEITWRNVDWWFYTKQTKVTETGLYNYSYGSFYDSGPDVSWFFDLAPERSSILEIEIRSNSDFFRQVNVEITLVAAYGPNAPPHVVSVSTSSSSATKILSSGAPSTFQIKLSGGETVKIRNVTPCRLPGTFEPSDTGIYKICFGVSKVIIFPENPAE